MLNKKLLGGSSGLPQDDNFENVTLLLNGDGTNGGQNNTFLDSSTNNFTITRNGNTTQGSFSPYGTLWSNYFNGSSDYLSIPANAAFNFGTGDFTVELWAYTTSTARQIIFNNYSQSGSTFGWAIQINVNSTGDLFWGWGNTTVSNPSNVWTANQWNHIAISRSGTTTKLFVNGAQVASVTDNTNYDDGANLIIGRNSALAATAFWFVGYVSNARVVKGTAVYTSAFTPSATPLTAITNTSLLTCQSNRFIDNSTNAFAITVNGSPSVQRFSPFEPSAPYSTSVIGGSGYFDGTGDYLNFSGSSVSSSTDLTLELWVYPTASISSGNYGLFASSDSRFGIITVSGNIYILASSDISTSTALPLNQWSHIAVTRTSGTLRVFFNGTEIGSASNSQSINGNWRIASNQGGEIFKSAYIASARILLGTGGTTVTVPTSPLTAITNTDFLCNFTNASIADLAMQNNLETVGNAQVSTSVKKYGTGSLYFDGTGDYLMTPSSPQWIMSGDWTIECWIYPTSVSGVNAIIDTRNRVNGATSPVMYLNGTSLVIDTGAAAVISAGTISTNTWYHVAATRSGNSWRLFIDGTQVGSTTTNTTSYTVAYGCTIGSSRFDEHFDGYIDDIRITKGLARYTANFTAPASALPTY